MIVITDDKTYASGVLLDDIRWFNPEYSLSNSMKSLTEKLFPLKKIFIGEMSSDEPWNYTFVTEVAEQSQYDVLIESAHEIPDLPDKIMCFAGSGKKFHGFRNRPWEAKLGNIHLSVLFNPRTEIQQFHSIFLAMSAVSVVEALDEIPSLKNAASFKWVNDILIHQAKACGVLAHTLTSGSTVNSAVLGIGLNVENTPDIKRDIYSPKISSLNEILAPEKLDYRLLLQNVLNKLMTNYCSVRGQSVDKIFTFYNNRLSFRGKNVRLYSDGVGEKATMIAEGKLTGVTNDLELILEGYAKPFRHGRLVHLDTDGKSPFKV